MNTAPMKFMTDRQARAMVQYEVRAREAYEQGNLPRAQHLWRAREELRERRSAMLRAMWELRRTRYEAPRQA